LTTAEHVARYSMLSLPVESELGRCMLSVREILALAPGSLIKLSSPVGSPVDLYAGGARLGSGEVIKTGKSLAVRVAFEKQKRG
jgi:flagellar motor switch protein FliN/FliY